MGTRLTLAEFEDIVRTEDYPLDANMLRAMYGEYTLDLPGGEETVGVVLERGGANDHYADPEAVLEELYCRIGVAGIGRPHYTDRGGIEGLYQRLSF